MNERTPEPQAEKYGSTRDRLLHTLCLDGWANASAGNIYAPQGYFYRVSNEEPDLYELSQAFSEELAAAGYSDATPLLGHYLVVEDRDGLVHVSQFESQDELLSTYEAKEHGYALWAGGQA